MYISSPWETAEPSEPVHPVTPGTSPFLDPNLPKHSVRGVIAVFAGFALLVVSAVLLYKRRARVAALFGSFSKGFCSCLAAARGLSFPMPASAFLCGWVPMPAARPPPHTGPSVYPPPPHEGLACAPTIPNEPDLPRCSPPGLGSSTAPRSPSPPPSYPPSPPPTPDLKSAARVSPASPIAPAAPVASAMPATPTVLPTPAPVMLSQSMLSRAPALRPSGLHDPGPPPSYPPPSLPRSNHTSAQSLGVGDRNRWIVPSESGLDQAAQIPKASSFLKGRLEGA
ncbi:hypothetical protein AURDEDRAFT_167855 [Auricularia subglabra TFB-10046 SS5]|nr:hypothetical protein AURDEDRAFT_167855 [Auricularia subglabra TFB-10046 SS5]